MVLFPLKFLSPYERVPYATLGLIGVHITASLLTLSHIPEDLILQPDDLGLQQLLTPGFLHGGWIHLASMREVTLSLPARTWRLARN